MLFFFDDDECIDRLDLTRNGAAARVYRRPRTPKQLLFSKSFEMSRPADLIDLRTIVERLSVDDLLDRKIQSRIAARICEVYSREPEQHRLWFVIRDVCEVLVALCLRVEGFRRPHAIPYSHIADGFEMSARFEREWASVFEYVNRDVETPHGLEIGVEFLAGIDYYALIDSIRELVEEAHAKKLSGKLMRFMIERHAGRKSGEKSSELLGIDLLS